MSGKVPAKPLNTKDEVVTTMEKLPRRMRENVSRIISQSGNTNSGEDTWMELMQT